MGASQVTTDGEGDDDSWSTGTSSASDVDPASLISGSCDFSSDVESSDAPTSRGSSSSLDSSRGGSREAYLDHRESGRPSRRRPGRGVAANAEGAVYAAGGDEGDGAPASVLVAAPTATATAAGWSPSTSASMRVLAFGCDSEDDLLSVAAEDVESKRVMLWRKATIMPRIYLALALLTVSLAVGMELAVLPGEYEWTQQASLWQHFVTPFMTHMCTLPMLFDHVLNYISECRAALTSLR